MSRDLIQIRRGLDSNLPILLQGEMGITLDTEKLVVGGLNGNIEFEKSVIINVKSYGAVGDGTTDDTQAIQNVFNESTDGNIIYFPFGFYKILNTLEIKHNSQVIFGEGVLIAGAGSNFEDILKATGKTDLKIYGLTFDANQLERVATQTSRYCGVLFTNCKNLILENITVKNTLGFNSIPAVGIGVTEGKFTTINKCKVLDCGSLTGVNGSDGIYTFGDNTIISNCHASKCTDTAFVLEGSNYGIISDCVANDCSVGVGISNFTSDHKIGNSVNGVNIINWKAINNGGVSIAVIGDQIGDLLDTTLSNVTVYSNKTLGFGVGSAISVRNGSVGKVKNLTIQNCLIDGCTLSPISSVGEDVLISNCKIKNGGDSCIALGGGSATIQSNVLTGGVFGLSVSGGSKAESTNNIIRNNTSWGIYVFDTSTLISMMDYVKSGGVGDINADGTAILELVGLKNNSLTINNSTGVATTGSIVNKFVVSDKNGSPLGYIPIYNI